MPNFLKKEIFKKRLISFEKNVFEAMDVNHRSGKYKDVELIYKLNKSFLSSISD